MQRRHLIICAFLLAVTVAASWCALRVWRQQQRAAIAFAGVPVLPDLSRWPAELTQRIQAAAAEMRDAKDPVASLAQLADLYYANGLMVPAKQAIEAMRRLEPKNPLWSYRFADLCMRGGESTPAEQALQATVQLDPTYLPAWYRLGYLRSQRNAFESARECYARAVSLAPGDTRAEYTLISFDARHDNRDDPRRRLIALVQAHPDIKDLHTLLAELNAAAGDSAGADRERNLAAGASSELPDDDPWMNGLAALCYDITRLGELTAEAMRGHRLLEAEDLLKKAARLAPADPLRRAALANHYEMTGRTDDAIATLEQAMVVFPNHVNLSTQLALVLCSVHRAGEAVTLLQRVVQNQPADAALHSVLGFALGQAGKNDEAARELREAIRLNPNQVESHFNLAACLFALGQPDAAQKAGEAALAIRPDYPEALALLASLAIDARDVATAERRINRLAALNQNLPAVQILFAALQVLKGNAAEQAGDPDEADKLYRTGLEAAPEYAPLLRERGLLALRRTQLSEAVELLEHYVRISPDDADGYILLGSALRAAGRPAEAHQLFEHGLGLARASNNQAQIQKLQRLLAL